MANNLLTLSEVADVLAVSRTTVVRMIRDHVLPAVNVSSAKLPRWRVERSALDAFVATRRTTQPRPTAQAVKLPPVPDIV